MVRSKIPRMGSKFPQTGRLAVFNAYYPQYFRFFSNIQVKHLVLNVLVTGFYNLQRCRQPVMQSGAFGYVQVLGGRNFTTLPYFIYFSFILFYISVSTYQKYKCVEVTECKLYMRVDDTKNYKRDNPVSMTRRIQNTDNREYIKIQEWL